MHYSNNKNSNHLMVYHLYFTCYHVNVYQIFKLTRWQYMHVFSIMYVFIVEVWIVVHAYY